MDCPSSRPRLWAEAICGTWRGNFFAVWLGAIGGCVTPKADCVTNSLFNQAVDAVPTARQSTISMVRLRRLRTSLLHFLIVIVFTAFAASDVVRSLSEVTVD
jgi:hypothetical protein